MVDMQSHSDGSSPFHSSSPLHKQPAVQHQLEKKSAVQVRLDKLHDLMVRFQVIDEDFKGIADTLEKRPQSYREAPERTSASDLTSALDLAIEQLSFRADELAMTAAHMKQII